MSFQVSFSTPSDRDAFLAGSRVTITGNAYRRMPSGFIRPPRNILIELLDAGRSVVADADLRLGEIGFTPAIGLFHAAFEAPEVSEGSAAVFTVRLSSSFLEDDGSTSNHAREILIDVHSPAAPGSGRTLRDLVSDDFEIAIAEPAAGGVVRADDPFFLQGTTAIYDSNAYLYAVLIDVQKGVIVNSILPEGWGLETKSFNGALEAAPIADGSTRSHTILVEAIDKRRPDLLGLGATEVRVEEPATRARGALEMTATRTRATLGPPTPFAAMTVESAEDSIELNSASVAGLQRLPGVGRMLARRIVGQRPFASVDDLRQVQGIRPEIFEEIRPLITVRPVD